MKPSDYVIKTQGHHAGKSGIVLGIIPNDLGRSYVLVYAEGMIRQWLLEFTEVIHESG
jgi:predicted lipase